MLAWFVAGVHAQLPQNVYFKFDSTTEFTSRGAIGNSPGRLSQALSPGHVAGQTRFTYSQYSIQDQDSATQEAWDLGFCGLDAAGDPAYATATFYVRNLRQPVGTGVRAWTINHSLTAPFTLAASREQWHHVWNFQQAANWVTDGLGVHMSQGGTWGTPPTLLCQNASHREIPRTDGTPQFQIIEDQAWSSGANAGKPVIQDCSWVLYLGFADPVLNGGFENAVYNSPCPNPSFGYGSLDPDFADNGSGTPPRYDNPHWLVNGGSNYAGGAAVLLMSMAVLPGGGVPVPPYGQLFLDLVDPLAALGPVVMPPMHPSRGYAEMTFNMGTAANPVRKIAASLPSWSTQAVVIAQNQPTRLTNVFTMRPIMLPQGFTAASAVQGTPVVVPKTPQNTTFAIRNDGRGELTVQQKINQTNVGPAVSIAERAMVRLSLLVAPNSIEVSSAKTTATGFVWAFDR
jgi:hypothetical protein